MNKIQETIELEILEELEALKKTQLGTEECEKTINGVAKLIDKSIELEKTVVEAELKKQELEIKEQECDIKQQQLEDEKKDRKIKNWLTAAGIAIPTGVTIWGTIKSLKFEQTGSITTILGKGFLNKLLPKK